MTTSRDSGSESEESLAPYRTPETSPSFHGYDLSAIHCYDSETEEIHDSILRHNRIVNIVVKDAHDIDGSGMLFTLGLYAPFKNVFDTFKAHTCTVCRDPEKIRFKADGVKLTEDDTPRKISPDLLHNQSLSIKAFSNCPGLKCATCKTNGYTSSHGEILDGHVPCGGEKGKKFLRLQFADPNGKVTAMSAGLRDPLKSVMRRYAQDTEANVHTLFFFFGGEKIDGEDAPEEMGMKNRSVIVVHMLSTSG
ncbi:hypothetical protein KC343_g5120 [Hortaea werneckii]|uniref:Ubiquitin-like domain-containing protein n=1 Tax=Hortaea werneckii TaxID=91943 RepID=A0A3M7HGU1_HORWE|nr:hypothetical protein KC352_g11572 [Hortaea werneckii]KAI7566911.1 hypothetical protein KC317_g5344 [Hortaea werneckii]KAI7618570.1 hypothetical protein KC346_g4943 [Hortaea werneckii]KAI7629625.1 hypothetical protein KC343_g5120 [Hortaea werneckii]KAI7674006.1 hypothetical protein KC319_g4919 [Hortaea werneckii]